MKKQLKFILLSVLLISSVSAHCQETTENVRLAFNAGSAKEMVRYFNKSTELKINNNGGNHSIVQAEPVLRDFFKLNPPSTFEYIHKGSSPEGLKYNIGQYKSGAKSFRIVVLLKKVDGQYFVDTLNINEE